MRFLFDGLNDLIINAIEDTWFKVSGELTELLSNRKTTMITKDGKIYFDVDLDEYFTIIPEIFNILSKDESDMLTTQIFYTNQIITDLQPFSFRLYNLHAEQRNCVSCKLCKYSMNEFIPNKGYGKLIGYGFGKYVFVAQNPSYVRYPGAITPIDNVGISGAFIKNVLSTGFSESFYYTNLVKCSTLNNEVPDEETIHICTKQWLLNEIDIVKPELIVCVGKVAADFFGGRIGSFTKWKEYNVYSVWHPSFVKRKNNYEDYNKQLRLIR